jgi:hypothetical protein
MFSPSTFDIIYFSSEDGIWCLELSYVKILDHKRRHIWKIWIRFITLYYTQVQFPQRNKNGMTLWMRYWGASWNVTLYEAL